MHKVWTKCKRFYHFDFFFVHIILLKQHDFLYYSDLDSLFCELGTDLYRLLLLGSLVDLGFGDAAVPDTVESDGGSIPMVPLSPG